MTTSTSTIPQGSAVEFRPLALTINALTIEGKAVTKAVWDQIPSLSVDRHDPIPEGLELLGWVAVEDKGAPSWWPLPFIGVHNGRPVRVYVFPADPAADSDAIEALTDAAACWMARVWLSGDKDTPPPLRGMSLDTARWAGGSLIQLRFSGAARRFSPSVSREVVESVLPRRPPAHKSDPELEAEWTEEMSEWVNLSADELESLKVRIDEGTERARVKFEELYAQRATVNALPQLYIAVGGKVR